MVTSILPHLFPLAIFGNTQGKRRKKCGHMTKIASLQSLRHLWTNADFFPSLFWWLSVDQAVLHIKVFYFCLWPPIFKGCCFKLYSIFLLLFLMVNHWRSFSTFFCFVFLILLIIRRGKFSEVLIHYVKPMFCFSPS